MSEFSLELAAFSSTEIPKASKVCSVSGRPFVQGEKIHSVLCLEGEQTLRFDLCAEEWRKYSRPQNMIACWTSRVGATDEKKPLPDANDALVALFEKLMLDPDQADLRYALALLLVRRRVFRFEMENKPQRGGTRDKTQDSIFVYSSRNDACYTVPVVQMDAKRVDEVQQRLVALIDAPSENVDDEQAIASAAQAAAEILERQ